MHRIYDGGGFGCGHSGAGDPKQEEEARRSGRNYWRARWIDFRPGWLKQYQYIILLMWANHYHSNPALTPVEISLSGLLNTFVSYMSPGQCWEIIISLFKWWNLMFNHWSLMFGMYLKPFLSVAGFKISCWTFLCDYFCLYVPGTLIDKSCLHKLHVTIFFHFFIIFIPKHHDTIEGSIRTIF